jgi:hypothetical protein
VRVRLGSLFRHLVTELTSACFWLVNYIPGGAWQSKFNQIYYSSGSYHVTRVAGASVQLTFEGTQWDYAGYLGLTGFVPSYW